MNEIIAFRHDQFGELRVLNTGEKPMFCLADVCRVLSLIPSTDFLAMLHKDKVFTCEISDSGGGKQKASFISEANLYKCIYLSHRQNATQFRDWVTGEVLPSILKKEDPVTDGNLERSLSDPDFLISLAQRMKQEKSLRQSAEDSIELHKKVIDEQTSRIVNMNDEIASLHESIDDMEKKGSYLDFILSATDTITITQIAADYGMSAIKLNRKLHEMGIQYYVDTQWVLYDKYRRMGLTSREIAVYADASGTLHSKQYTKWTQRGRLFLYEKLKAQGICPLVETQQRDMFLQ